MTSMIILGFTGMYLRFPFFVSNRVIMRNTHYVFMIIVIVVLVWRVWYAFFSKTNADWREFAIGKKDLGSMLGVLAYYGYFSDSKPHVAKYNVMQKMSYAMFLVMMIAQAHHRPVDLALPGADRQRQPVRRDREPSGRHRRVGYAYGPLRHQLVVHHPDHGAPLPRRPHRHCRARWTSSASSRWRSTRSMATTASARRGARAA